MHRFRSYSLPPLADPSLLEAEDFETTNDSSTMRPQHPLPASFSPSSMMMMMTPPSSKRGLSQKAILNRHSLCLDTQSSPSQYLSSGFLDMDSGLMSPFFSATTSSVDSLSEFSYPAEESPLLTSDAFSSSTFVPSEQLFLETSDTQFEKAEFMHGTLSNLQDDGLSSFELLGINSDLPFHPSPMEADTKIHQRQLTDQSLNWTPGTPTSEIDQLRLELMTPGSSPVLMKSNDSFPPSPNSACSMLDSASVPWFLSTSVVSNEPALPCIPETGNMSPMFTPLAPNPQQQQHVHTQQSLLSPMISSINTPSVNALSPAPSIGRPRGSSISFMSPESSGLKVSRPRSKSVSSSTSTPKKQQDDEVKRIKCPHCDKMFLRQYHLKSHLVCHSKERPHACQFCPASFARKHDLQRHVRTLHGLSRSFKCGQCCQSFVKVDSLYRHMLNELHTSAHGTVTQGNKVLQTLSFTDLEQMIVYQNMLLLAGSEPWV